MTAGVEFGVRRSAFGAAAWGRDAHVKLGIQPSRRVPLNLCNLWMFSLFCVLLRVLRMIPSSPFKCTLAGDRTWFYDPSELRTPNPELTTLPVALELAPLRQLAAGEVELAVQSFVFRTVPFDQAPEAAGVIQFLGVTQFVDQKVLNEFGRNE